MSALAQDGGYSFQTINFQGDTFIPLLGISSSGTIAGYHGADPNNRGFVLALPNTFTAENFKDADQTQVIGINNRGDTAGFYITAGTTHGFVDIDGTFQPVDFKDTMFNQLLGLDTLDQAAGFYEDADGNDHPYIFDAKRGAFSAVPIPIAGVKNAQATGINDPGRISGFYVDPNNPDVNHGFLLADGTLTTLDPPGSTSTQAFGLNNRGQVVGAYLDAAGNTHGFVYRDGRFQSVDDPQGVNNTLINGINPRGQIVGFYGPDACGGDVCNGFVGTPGD